MAKKPTKATVNPIVIDEKLINVNAGSPNVTEKKVPAPPPEEKSLVTSGVLKSRH